jgi:hypothetical protein
MILAKAQDMLEALQEDYGKLVEDCGLTDVVLVVVRLFICTQKQISVPPLCLYWGSRSDEHQPTQCNWSTRLGRKYRGSRVLNNESPPAVVVTPHLQPPLGGWEAWTEIHFPRNCIEAQCSYGSSAAHTYPPILQIQQERGAYRQTKYFWKKPHPTIGPCWQNVASNCTHSLTVSPGVVMWACIRQSPSVEILVYYESRKRELKTKPIYECRCDERLKTKTEKSARLAYTGLHGELEHRKIKTRLIDETFASVMASVCFWSDGCPINIYNRLPNTQTSVIQVPNPAASRLIVVSSWCASAWNCWSLYPWSMWTRGGLYSWKVLRLRI